MSENKNDNRWSDFGSICPQCGCLGSWLEEEEGQWRCKCCGYIQQSSTRSDNPSPTEEEEDRQDDRDLPLVEETPSFDCFNEDDLTNFELGND